MSISQKIFTIVILLTSCTFAFADDEELYEPKVKDNEGLIRVLNLSEKVVSLSLNGGGTKLFSIKPFSFSDYVVFKEGAQIFLVGERQVEKNVERGSSTTLVIDNNSSVTLLEDKRIIKNGKSMISFYNFTRSNNLSLKTANGKTTIIADTVANTSGYREINPVRLKSTVFSDTTVIKIVDEKLLMRNTPFNIAIFEHSGNFITILADSSVNTRK
jgi:alginate O-acetyltransferase complex protein AlgF